MATSCSECCHPDTDHVAGECLHDGPEDRCQERPDPIEQCQCTGYRPDAGDPAPWDMPDVDELVGAGALDDE